MFYYDFSITGLRLRVKSPFALNNLFELSGYEIAYDPDMVPDVLYSLELLAPDWQVRGQCVLSNRQNAVYHWQGEEHRYYYWNLFSMDRFVLVRYDLNDLRHYTLYFQAEDVQRLLPQLRLSAFFSPERLLLQQKAIQLHSSVIDWNGAGILFTAPSGTGKSTQAQLWQSLENAAIINGDRGIIQDMQDHFRVWGSPYAGSSSVYTNTSVPIRAIVVLSQASQNTLRRLTPVAAFTHLYRESTVLSWDDGFVDGASALLLKLIVHVPVYHLSCRPDAEAVSILKEELAK